LTITTDIKTQKIQIKKPAGIKFPSLSIAAECFLEVGVQLSFTHSFKKRKIIDNFEKY
jgi:hypothetical protein